MKIPKKWILLFFLMCAGCAQAVTTYSVEDIDLIPQKTYKAYLYRSGDGGMYRAVLLIKPEIDVEIVPYSEQIYQGTGTFEEAMAFMKRAFPLGKYKGINVKAVNYREKTIGYLLEFPRHPFQRVYLEVNLYERDGKIYFSVTESIEHTES